MWRSLTNRLRKQLGDEQFVLELLLIGCSLGLASLIHWLNGNKSVVLNLFYVPVVLSGFFLGRYRAGIMALLCVIAASLFVAHKPAEFAASTSTVVVGLSIVVWGAALCMTALLVGSLSDQRNAKVHELHEAYVGVVEVLSKYLQSANPKLRDRATRVVQLCQRVARELQLSPQQIDDIRVAALMVDLGKIEVTTRLISRAVGTLECNSEPVAQSSFHGLDLVHSLGTVLKGAIPLLASQGEAGFQFSHAREAGADVAAPVGARIIRIVRAYETLTAGSAGNDSIRPEQALAILAQVETFAADKPLLSALARTVLADGHDSERPATPDRRFADAGMQLTV